MPLSILKDQSLLLFQQANFGKATILQKLYPTPVRKKIYINTIEVSASGLLVVQLATDKRTRVEKLVIE